MDNKNCVYEIIMGNYKQIGSSCNVKHRMSCHKSTLLKNKHWNSTMQNVWNKYQMFEYNILSEWSTREEAYKEEQRLLDLYFKKPFYMMQSPSAFGVQKGRVSPMKGRKNSDEHIKKRSDARRGQKMSNEQRLNVSLGHIVNKMKIFQYDLFGNIIKKWESVQDLKNTEFSMGNVVRCCKGIRKSAYNFKWKFEEVIHA